MPDLKIHKQLMAKGVKIINPETVFIGEEVDPSRIQGRKVTLYPGTRIAGKNTLIMEGVKLGEETPVTLENCFVGPHVALKGGFFSNAVFAGGNSFGSGAHVREGTILEEQAGAAHCVGLKQTILFPFVTLGSLINFCDCLMTGGTDRKNHSEVGSSFVHFNYTPFQDKATPSLMGNVYEGVMLNQNPVFLGGQGGMVGPCRLNFGCVTAAGSIIRKDEIKKNRLIFGGSFKETSVKRPDNIYKNISRIYNNNSVYIASLISLMKWYRNVRCLFALNFFQKELYFGMMGTLYKAIAERIKRLEEFTGKLDTSLDSNKKIVHKFHISKQFLENAAADENYYTSMPQDFMEFMSTAAEKGKSYIETVKNLDGGISADASQWLYTVEKQIFERIKI